jgi:hypothetical protein
MNRFFCKCGMRFREQRFITEHIGICNPKWPRTSLDDEHIQITAKEWEAKFIHGEKDNEAQSL